MITPEPARWGKGVGFGNAAIETPAQKQKKQLVAMHDINMATLFDLICKMISSGTTFSR